MSVLKSDKRGVTGVVCVMDTTPGWLSERRVNINKKH